MEKNSETLRRKCGNNSQTFPNYFDRNFVKLSGTFWSNVGKILQRTRSNF